MYQSTVFNKAAQHSVLGNHPRSCAQHAGFSRPKMSGLHSTGGASAAGDSARLTGLFLASRLYCSQANSTSRPHAGNASRQVVRNRRGNTGSEVS